MAYSRLACNGEDQGLEMTAVQVLRPTEASPASATGFTTIFPLPAVQHWGYGPQLALVFATYFLAGRVGLVVPFTSGNVSPVWPPAGIALAALLLLGARVWPAIAAGAFLVNYLSPISPGAAMVLAAGNTAGPLVGAWLVRQRPGFSPSLSRLDDVLGLILIAAPACAAISATVGVTVLFVAHVDPWTRFWPAWLVWWLGDALGVLIVAPLVLTLLKQRRITRLRHAPELVALLTAAAITCVMVFDSRLGLRIERDVLAFAVLPFVLWAAIRFEMLGAACVTLLISCMAVAETGSGSGPFIRNSTLQNATMLQGFIGVISLSGLTLAAVIVERAQLIRQQAQREGVEQGERRYREIVETANDGIWMLDGQLATVFVNTRMAEILGYTVEEMSGKPLSDFISEKSWGRKHAGLHEHGLAMRERSQTHYRRKNGSEAWVTVSRTRAFAEDGTLTGVLKMVSDISAQKHAEGERREALDRVGLLSSAVEQTADSVFISDSAGRIEYVNPAFEETTGFTRDEALGSTPRLLKSGHQGAEFYRQMWARLLAGEPFRGALVNRKKSGELYWANQTITPIKNGQGDITHFVAVLKDVTEIRKYHDLEVQLRLARAVQQRFYSLAPTVPGFDIGAASFPAAETGGDYFDFIEAPHGILYIAIGDVSGHGFDAALVMALTRAYVRSFATLGMNAGEVLQRVNQAIIGDLEPERYVTMLLVRLDVLGGGMSYASAGHIPGVLLHCSGTTDCLLSSTGVPLGLFAEATYPSRRLQFRPQQILVLVTDGAAETVDANESDFGHEGITDYVRTHANDSAHAIAVGLFAAARAFGGAEPQRDDITSVIIKVTDAPLVVEQPDLPL